MYKLLSILPFLVMCLDDPNLPGVKKGTMWWQLQCIQSRCGIWLTYSPSWSIKSHLRAALKSDKCVGRTTLELCQSININKRSLLNRTELKVLPLFDKYFQYDKKPWSVHGHWQGLLSLPLDLNCPWCHWTHLAILSRNQIWQTEEHWNISAFIMKCMYTMQF